MVSEIELDVDRSGPMAMERAFDILALLAEHADGLSFSAIQQHTGISKAILSRLLKAMIARDVLTHHERTYARSVGLLRFTRGLAPPPHSRRAVALASEPIAQQLFQQIEQTVMVLHWNGDALESLHSLVPDEGLAAWPVGTQRNQLAKGPFGWHVLHEQGFDAEAIMKREGFRDQHQAMLYDTLQQCDLAAGAIVVKQAHCWRIMHAIRCEGGRLVGLLASFVNPVALARQQRGQLAPLLQQAAEEISHRLGWRPEPDIL